MSSITLASIEDVEDIQKIAIATWPAAYRSILTAAQMEYMLSTMYNPDTLIERLQSGNLFFIGKDLQNHVIGFAEVQLAITPHTAKLHKLYVLPNQQGFGMGKSLLDKVKEIAKAANQQAIVLNVNRNNKAQDFYKRQGFSILQEEDIAIGQGYYMNDYIMQYLLN